MHWCCAMKLKWKGEKGRQRQHIAAICSSTTYKEQVSKRHREKVREKVRERERFYSDLLYYAIDEAHAE